MDLKKEKEIIKKAKQDPEFFGLLYDEYYKEIFGYILRRTADIDLAQDLTSQTFFKALKSLWKFRWQNVPFSAWLYRIAINEINSFYRKKNRLVRIDFDKIPEIPSVNTSDEEIKAAEKEIEEKKEFIKIHESISKINPSYQAVISLRFFENKKISEISQILKKSEGTIKSQIHRALEELRELVK